MISSSIRATDPSRCTSEPFLTEPKAETQSNIKQDYLRKLLFELSKRPSVVVLCTVANCWKFAARSYISTSVFPASHQSGFSERVRGACLLSLKPCCREVISLFTHAHKHFHLQPLFCPSTLGFVFEVLLWDLIGHRVIRSAVISVEAQSLLVLRPHEDVHRCVLLRSAHVRLA